MGYESKIYIVEKSKHTIEDGKRFAQIIAIFDLCRFDTLTDCLRKLPATDCFIYADDGDTKILDDEYGDSLKECTPEHLKTVIKLLLSNGTSYRRLFPVLATLEAILQHREQWGEIACLHYGH